MTNDRPLPLSLRRLAVVLLLVAAWFIAPFLVSLPSGLLKNPDASPVMVDRHGTPISRLTLPDATRAIPVNAADLPPDLIACTLAAEDKRFYHHGGIDFLATLRAIRDLLSQRRIVSGASTITQQLIKISTPPANRTPRTKIYEALAARRLEMMWTKSQILTAYLNRLDYGNLRTGAAEASRFYFQKPLADLSLAECALLAGLPQAPSRLNPLRRPARALTRRDTVLKRLADFPGIDATRVAQARRESLSLRPLRESSPAPWLASFTPQLPLATTGCHLPIPTTLDLPIQQEIEIIVRNETARLSSANLRHAAVVVIHNPTGEIRALVSSADWKDPRGGQINGALLPRSPGSTLKPFTYLLAMARNHRTPASILADIPSPFRTPQGLDLPQNYDQTYRGPVTLRAALACSLNVPAMRELNELGGPAPLHALLTSLGLTTLGTDATIHGLGLTIGNAPVRLLELTNAYATLARRGLYLPAIIFPNRPHAQASQLPFSANQIDLITHILADPAARAPAFPPGGPLDLPFPCAVKTGTSSNFCDNWCIGYTPEFTVGVWAGNFENQPMKGISGVSGAGPIFHRTMLTLARDHPPCAFAPLTECAEITIDSRTGKLIPTTSQIPFARHDYVPKTLIPPAAAATDYDSSGKALLDATYAAWFGSRHNLRNAEFALDATSAVCAPLKIITPAEGATLLLDPEIPSGSGRLRPVTNLPGTARWSSLTLLIDPALPEPIIHLVPGTHTLTATDSRTGSAQHITIHVKSM